MNRVFKETWPTGWRVQFRQAAPGGVGYVWVSAKTKRGMVRVWRWAENAMTFAEAES